MNYSVNEVVNEWRDDKLNERWKVKRMNERMNQRMTQWMNERNNVLTNHFCKSTKQPINLLTIYQPTKISNLSACRSFKKLTDE